jgi:hypothetical protein
MIDHLDTLLHRLFRHSIAELTANGQVRFDPPDAAWRERVSTIKDAAGLHANSLNVYLVDLRENRKLKTIAREQRVVEREIYDARPPRRVDCHYLISAWSPVAPSSMTDSTLHEHALLAEAARVLGELDALDPVAICAAARAPNLPAITVPDALVGETLPLVLLPVDGFPQYAEFWGTMGEKSRWKPCVYAVITVALKSSAVRADSIAATTITDTPQRDTPAVAQTHYHIGGQVFAAAVAPRRGAAVAPRQPVPRAWVELLDAAGTARVTLTRADSDARFTFGNVPAGSYQLRATSQPEGTTSLRPITVPEPSGNYDLSFGA